MILPLAIATSLGHRECVAFEDELSASNEIARDAHLVEFELDQGVAQCDHGTIVDAEIARRETKNLQLLLLEATNQSGWSGRWLPSRLGDLLPHLEKIVDVVHRAHRRQLLKPRQRMP